MMIQPYFEEQLFAVDELSILCPDGTYQSDCTGHESVSSTRQDFINKVWCAYYNNPPYINVGSPIYDGKDFNFFYKAENVTDYEFAVAKQYCDEQYQKKQEYYKKVLTVEEPRYAIDPLPIDPLDEFVYAGEVSYFGERMCPDGTMQPYKSSSEQSDCIGHEAPASVSISRKRCPDGVTFGIDDDDCRRLYPPDPTDPLVPIARLAEIARECADGTLIATYKYEDEHGLRYPKGVIEYKSKACGYKPAERDSGSVTWCENGNLVGDFTDGIGGMYRKIAEYGAPNCVDTIGSGSMADLKLENLLNENDFLDFRRGGGGYSGRFYRYDPLPEYDPIKIAPQPLRTYDPLLEYDISSPAPLEAELPKIVIDYAPNKGSTLREYDPIVSSPAPPLEAILPKIAPQEVGTSIAPIDGSIDTKSLAIALGIGFAVWYLLNTEKD